MEQILYTPQGPAVFGGVRYWAKSIGTEQQWRPVGPTAGDVGESWHYLAFPMAIGPSVDFVVTIMRTFIDLPFSVCGDLILLPFSAINEVVEGGIHVDEKPPPRVRQRSY